MNEVTADCAAWHETVVFLSHFKDLKDPRQQGKITYPLDEVLLLCLLAVLAGAETIVDIAWFGGKKLALLRRFRRFRDGTPAHDHLGDILAALDAEQFQRCFDELRRGDPHRQSSCMTIPRSHDNPELLWID